MSYRNLVIIDNEKISKKNNSFYCDNFEAKISEDFNAKLILERFKDNPFLPKFYEDKTRYAFPLEMSFLADRYQQLADDIAQYDLFTDFIVSDYDVFKSLILIFPAIILFIELGMPFNKTWSNPIDCS